MLLGSLLFASSPGCQAVNAELATLAGEQPATQEPSAPAPSGPQYQIEIRREGQQPQLTQLPLAEPLFVQQVLEQAGAVSKFRRMKVEIYRKLPNGGGQRLDVPYDRAKRRVPPGGDYAIHANDRVVITEDTTTVIDDMIQTLTPFSK
jgi:hypothetical protein